MGIHMKIAIPVNSSEGLDAKVPRYFSQGKFFLIADVNDHTIGKTEVIENKLPARVKDITGAGAFLLSGKGVDAIVASHIAEKDRLSMVGNNIRVFLGATGTASNALKEYISGKLTESSECKKNPDECDCC